jgi:LmbE family N-acetylglucosaminyl deacetylase
MLERICLMIALVASLMTAAEKRCLLAVFSHPDDETTIGPLLAKYAKEGHDVYLAAITSGQKGATPHGKIPAGDELGAAREAELRCSAKALGIHPPFALGFQDQGLSTPPVMEKATQRLREIIEQVKPQVIITFGPEGVTGHPDHRTTHSIVSEIFQQRGRLRHQPERLYLVAFPESLFAKMPAGMEMARPFKTVSDIFITTEIDGRRGDEAADRAIDCHQTQWTPEQMKVMKVMKVQSFGGRVYLRRAASVDERPARRENSLFAP